MVSPLLRIVFVGIAIYYAVRIAKSVGTFWAWSLIIAAFVLGALEYVASFVETLELPQSQLDGLVNSLGAVRIWQSLAVGSLSSLFFAFGMFGLMRVFEKIQKRSM